MTTASLSASAPRAERPGALYAGARAVARFWLWFFFKSVDVRHPERVPAAGPVLLCINHPNNLIDSLLVAAVLGRKVHYLATAALFRQPLVRRFLLACGAIPVYRRQDDPTKMERNTEAFAACFDVLAGGGVIGIYPEGTTHAERRVQRIKTGAARIALDAEARRLAGPPAASPPLALIPVGLNFEARKSFRARVLVAFGEPIELRPYVAQHEREATAGVDELTTAIQAGMEAEVVHVRRIDTERLIRAVEELYRGELVRELQEEQGLQAAEIDTFRLSRSIAAAAAHFAEREPDRVEQLWQRIRSYQAMLADYRVTDAAVRARIQRLPAVQRLRRGWDAAAGLPIFAYGFLVNALPYLVPRWLAHRLGGKETSYATTRFLASIVAFPFFWGLETWLVARLAGALWAAAFLLSLPLTGAIAHRYLTGAGTLRYQLRLGALALRRHTAAARLLDERRALMLELDRARNDYLAATKGSSF